MGKKKVSLARSASQPTTAPPVSRGPLRLRVRAGAESILRTGHPWLFAESIRDQSRPGLPGELAVVYDHNNRFLALGLFDPNSAIRLRILLNGNPQPVDDAFWNERLEGAIQRRGGCFGADTTGFRWINGESDGWPGLVLDRYDRTLVIKLYTAAWLPWLGPVTAAISKQLQPERIVLRLSRNAQDVSAKHFGRHDGEIIRGAPLRQPVVFLETGLRFEADVLRGQKTGFFLDQRENRRQVEALAKGRTVLNAFSFSGGFSVYAARGGAESVSDLDISGHALAAGQKNFTLNKSNPAVNTCRHQAIQADAFVWLAANRSRKFDLIILDPPSLARREEERSRAITAYTRLASMAATQLKPGGILVACSCSAHVSSEEFFQAVHAAIAKSPTRFTEMARTGQPPDHPAAIPEAEYLKSIYLARC